MDFLKHLQNIKGSISTVIQANQLGTADAVKSAMPNTKSDEIILVLYGDVPLVSARSLQELIDQAAGEFYVRLIRTALIFQRRKPKLISMAAPLSIDAATATVGKNRSTTG